MVMLVVMDEVWTLEASAGMGGEKEMKMIVGHLFCIILFLLWDGHVLRE